MLKPEIGPGEYGAWVETARHCRGLVFKGVDMRADDWRLAKLPQAERPGEGCVFIDCKLGPQMREAAGLHYGIVFPELAGRVFHAYRGRLYTPDELFAGFRAEEPESYWRTPDCRIYESYLRVNEDHRPVRPPKYVDVSADEMLARRLHDHFINQELNRYLAGFASGVVAFMGGHDALRSEGVYRQVAEMARELARGGYLVATGGGPGLMEAANLGAYLAPHPDGALDEAIAGLSVAGGDRYDERYWLSRAWEVRAKLGGGGGSVGVPTWFYGHEPPNVFASAIAKYFENSHREEGLLAIATHGIVFAPGNGGTVQEIFQDGCQNYYETYGHKSPMILFDEGYWNPAPDAAGKYPGKTKPAWPLLRKLAEEKGFAELVAVTSDPAEVLRRIRGFAVR
jgi:predicted Rossmann-fold nucleotide-binding protein